MEFVVDGRAARVADERASLLEALRDELGLRSPKDGCSPQGQCGCCTVLVDGEPRVACVTPIARVANRAVVTIEGLDPADRDRLAAAFVATGGSQCGFCTPGIIMRASGGRTRDLDRALAAHLCRCTGWRTIYDALESPTAAATVGPIATLSTAGACSLGTRIPARVSFAPERTWCSTIWRMSMR